MKTGTTLRLTLAGLLISIWSLAAPEPYSDATKVNLLRRVDANGNLPVVTASVDPGYAHGAHRAMDAGMQPWRINPNEAANEWLRIALPEAVTVDKLDVYWRGSYQATDYVIGGSTTGFGALTALASGAGGANGSHPIHNITPASVKYLELDATGFAHPDYYITHELSAYGPGPVFQRQGYNMLFEPGKVGPMTTNMRRNIVDDPANAVDAIVGGSSVVRGGTIDDTSGVSWFVIPLADAAELMALSLGMWEDQPWSDVQVYVAGESTYDYLLDSGSDTWPGMTWTQVYDHPSGNFPGAHVTFTPQQVQYVRVQFPTSSSALTEVELFETYLIPEPTSLVLLALSGLLLGRRGRRK